MEILKGNPIYTIKNPKNELLNIRIIDNENNTLWNAHKDKRYWIARDIYQAIAQAGLINIKEGENASVVEISEVQAINNNPPELA